MSAAFSLKMPFMPQYERDRLDAQRHALEDRARGLGSLELQPQFPALLRVGIDHAHERAAGSRPRCAGSC